MMQRLIGVMFINLLLSIPRAMLFRQDLPSLLIFR